jgi:DNA-binding IclR family transcriptional regulator
MMILEVLAEHRTGLTLTTLGQVIGLPKTSLLSLLRVLESSGYVAVKDLRYYLGPFGYRLGALISSTFEAVNVFQSGTPSTWARRTRPPARFPRRSTTRR